MRCWLKECTVREISLADAAWLAGFFDGEGSVGRWKGGREGKYWATSFQIVNTHLPSLLRCKRITGCGSIQRKKTRPNHKKSYCFRVTSQRNILAILRQIRPHLTVKRVLATEVMECIKDLE